MWKLKVFGGYDAQKDTLKFLNEKKIIPEKCKIIYDSDWHNIFLYYFEEN